jgi:hypothetical protein
MVDRIGGDGSGSKGDKLLPENSDNRTAQTEGAHPISLVDNGGDGRGPELMMAYHIITLLDLNLTSHYSFAGGMSCFNRAEAVNAVLSIRFSALGRGGGLSKYLR